jgi:hypothetical protein
LSINVVHPAPNVKPFVGIERANGFNSGKAIVWDSGYRAFNPGYVRLYASGTDYTLIDKWGDDIAPSSTFTQITAPTTGTLSAVYDGNESSSATWSAPANAITNLFSFDLGAQKTVFINVVVSANISSSFNFIIYGSNDNSTWIQVGYKSITATGTLFIAFGYGNYRYFKVSINNTNTSAYNGTVYEVEVWTSGNTLKTYSATTTTQLYALVNNASYQVLEVVYP